MNRRTERYLDAIVRTALSRLEVRMHGGSYRLLVFTYHKDGRVFWHRVPEDYTSLIENPENRLELKEARAGFPSAELLLKVLQLWGFRLGQRSTINEGIRNLFGFDRTQPVTFLDGNVQAPAIDVRWSWR